MTLKNVKQNIGAFKFYALLICLVGIAGYFGFTYGNQHYALQRADMATLKQTLSNLSQENNQLTKKLHVLGVELEVQRLANLNSQKIIEQGLQRESEIRQQLSFYQKVMAPELKERGFAIDAFNVERALSDGFYRFDLVLMQQSKIKNVVKGNINVIIKGSQSDKPVSLNLSQLIKPEQTKLSFSFKYFQVLQGQFELPKDFLPEKVEVSAEVFQFKRKKGNLTRTFDWSDVETKNKNIAE